MFRPPSDTLSDYFSALEFNDANQFGRNSRDTNHDVAGPDSLMQQVRESDGPPLLSVQAQGKKRRHQDTDSDDNSDPSDDEGYHVSNTTRKHQSQRKKRMKGMNGVIRGPPKDINTLPNMMIAEPAIDTPIEMSGMRPPRRRPLPPPHVRPHPPQARPPPQSQLTPQARPPPSQRYSRGKSEGTGRPKWLAPDGRSRVTREETQLSWTEKQRWLASSRRWEKAPLHFAWRGIKVLGMGSYGLVGLWENPVYKDDSRFRYWRMVVKQSKSADLHLQHECLFLRRLQETDSKHIVEQYTGYHVEKGQGTSAWDSSHTNISRIYLEYCEKGDMNKFIKDVTLEYPRESPLPENSIWKIWSCLIGALCVLAHGTEAASAPDRSDWPRAIGHFDIKPANILVGKCDDNLHASGSIFKLADFGSAAHVDPIQTEEWMDDIGKRGTYDYLPPEQLTPSKVINRRLGTEGNVWQIGKCMYELVKRGREFNRTMVREVRFDGETEFFTTFGDKIRFVDAYSMSLKMLILKCLAVDPTMRPTPRQLRADCNLALSESAPPLPDIEMGDVSAFGENLPAWTLPDARQARNWH